MEPGQPDPREKKTRLVGLLLILLAASYALVLLMNPLARKPRRESAGALRDPAPGPGQWREAAGLAELRLEAESGTLAGASARVKPAGASGGEALRLGGTATGRGRATWRFRLRRAGAFRFWLRLGSGPPVPSSAGATRLELWVDNREQPLSLAGPEAGGDGWAWQAPAGPPLELPAGDHTLEISATGPGCLLDQVALR